MEYIQTLNPIIQAFLATLLTWLITALGSSIVFLFKKVNKNWLDGMLAASAGIMLAASFWSLLLPGITQAENLGFSLPLIITVGILSGGLLLIIGNKVCDTIGKKQDDKQKRIRMLITSITIHNIPEGLAIGVAFGSVIYGLDGATLLAAWTLAIGIGIQNFPEGSAISLPLKREGASAKKAFLVGQFSGIVEPISAVIGALLVMKIRMILPFLLCFAAGAMIYVVVMELIPESQNNKSKDKMTILTMIGFVIMTLLDVLLG